MISRQLLRTAGYGWLLALLMMAPACGSRGGSASTSSPAASEEGDHTVAFQPVASVLSTVPPEYELGRVWLDASGIEEARAAESPDGRWGVQLLLLEGQEGIGAFNALAESCYERDIECPTAMLAISVDGEVVTAPEVNATGFERDQLEISNGRSRESAEALAADINAAAHAR